MLVRVDHPGHEDRVWMVLAAFCCVVFLNLSARAHGGNPVGAYGDGAIVDHAPSSVHRNDVTGGPDDICRLRCLGHNKAAAVSQHGCTDPIPDSRRSEAGLNRKGTGAHTSFIRTTHRMASGK